MKYFLYLITKWKNQMFKFKYILAACLLVFSVFGFKILDILDQPAPKPDPTPHVSILTIDIPSEDIKNYVKKFSTLITDPTDKAKLAIFNYQFATNVKTYDATVQQVNDVYTLAGKTFFKDTLLHKYNNLAQMIIDTIQQVSSDENHTLSTEEKDKISEYFMGIAWALIQKETT